MDKTKTAKLSFDETLQLAMDQADQIKSKKAESVKNEKNKTKTGTMKRHEETPQSVERTYKVMVKGVPMNVNEANLMSELGHRWRMVCVFLKSCKNVHKSTKPRYDGYAPSSYTLWSMEVATTKQTMMALNKTTEIKFTNNKRRSQVKIVMISDSKNTVKYKEKDFKMPVQPQRGTDPKQRTKNVERAKVRTKPEVKNEARNVGRGIGIKKIQLNEGEAENAVRQDEKDTLMEIETSASDSELDASPSPVARLIMQKAKYEAEIRELRANIVNRQNHESEETKKSEDTRAESGFDTSLNSTNKDEPMHSTGMAELDVAPKAYTSASTPPEQSPSTLIEVNEPIDNGDTPGQHPCNEILIQALIAQRTILRDKLMKSTLAPTNVKNSFEMVLAVDEANIEMENTRKSQQRKCDLEQGTESECRRNVNRAVTVMKNVNQAYKE